MKTKIHYQITPSKSRIPTVQAQMNDEVPFYLHSTIKPHDEGIEWVRKLELTADTCYVVLGAGLGYHIEALLKQLPVNSQVWVLMTPSEVELVNYAATRSEQNWLTDKRMFILLLTNLHDMAVLIANSMIKYKVKTICLCRHFPAMRLAQIEYKEIEVSLVSTLRKIMALNFNMKVAVEHTFFSNYWRNFAAYVLNPGSHFWQNSFVDLPIIIVAAGPSLNKNIEELKKCADKAVIIAAGSALGALYKHGITPHFLIVTDGNPIMYEELKDFFSAETVLVVTTSVAPEVVENYPGPKCFFDTWLPHNDSIKKYMPETLWLCQTSSVATAAVDFANRCGARTIILVGQDLAFPTGSHHHADGVLAGPFTGWPIIKIPGYYGEEVDSTDQFKVVVGYYNEYMKSNSHIDFINATEGGALIEAARNVPLETVHQQILKKTINKNMLVDCFMRRNGETRQLRKIIEHLYKMSKWVKNLSEQVQEFSQKEHSVISRCKNLKGEVIQEDIQRFEAFFIRIRRRSIYPYIASSVEGWLTLLKFQVSDGMSIDQQYEFYQNVIRDIQLMLNDLLQSLTDNIKTLDLYERGVE